MGLGFGGDAEQEPPLGVSRALERAQCVPVPPVWPRGQHWEEQGTGEGQLREEVTPASGLGVL